MAKPKKKKQAKRQRAQQRRREKTKAKKKAKARAGGNERIRLDPQFAAKMSKAEETAKQLEIDLGGRDWAEVVTMDINKSTEMLAGGVVAWMLKEQHKWFEISKTSDIDAAATGDQVVKHAKKYILDLSMGFMPEQQRQAYEMIGQKVGRLIEETTKAQHAGPIVNGVLNPLYNKLIPDGFAALGDEHVKKFQKKLITSVYEYDREYDIETIDKICKDLRAVKAFEDREEQAEMTYEIISDLEDHVRGAVIARLAPVAVQSDDGEYHVVLNDEGKYEKVNPDGSKTEVFSGTYNAQMEDMTPEERALFEQSPAAFLGKKLIEDGVIDSDTTDDEVLEMIGLADNDADGIASSSNTGDSVDPDPLADLANSMNNTTAPIPALDGVTPKSLKDKTVMQYIDLMAVLYGISRKGNPNVDQRNDASLAWAIMRDARIYSIDYTTYGSIWGDADRYTTETIAGLSYRPPGMKGEPPEHETRQHTDRIMQASKNMGMPDFLPFPNMFIGYGDGIYLSPTQAAIKKLPPGGSHWRTVGHLITSTGHVWEFSRFIAPDGSEGVSLDHVCDSGKWGMTYDLCPWVVNIIIKLLLSYGTYVVEEDLGKGNRRKYKDGRKRMGVKKGQKGYIPPPYYTLRLRSQLVKKGTQDALPRPQREITHIRDVSGYTSLKMRRGDLPLDPALRARLETPTKKGNVYVVYTVTDPIPEHALAMHNRGIKRKEKHEWIALMFIKKENFLWPKPENRPDLQYVPATRVVPAQEVELLDSEGEEDGDE